jgi:hypothetical protein
MQLDTILRTILTTAGKSNAAYWNLARYVAESQANLGETYLTIASAWDRVSAANSVVMLAPAESTVRQLGASAKLWGAVATDRHSPFHAYAWRKLAKPEGADGKRVTLTGDALQAAWDSIPANRPEPKPNPKGTVNVKVSVSTHEKLSALADAAGVDIETIIIGLLDK